MAKKRKYEFKPDKIGGSILSKLYLTQKQRLSLLKWLLYGLVLLVLSVLQDVILCQMRLLGTTTELVPCGIFLICILEGSQSGCVFTLVASMLYLFSGSAPGTYSIVVITLLGVVAAIFRQSYLQKGFSAAMLCVSAAMLLYELVTYGMVLFLGLTSAGQLARFLVTAGLSLLAAPLLYPIVRSIGTIGGETWKE